MVLVGLSSFVAGFVVGLELFCKSCFCCLFLVVFFETLKVVWFCFCFLLIFKGL